jgi:hypothetical protein
MFSAFPSQLFGLSVEPPLVYLLSLPLSPFGLSVASDIDVHAPENGLAVVCTLLT